MKGKFLSKLAIIVVLVVMLFILICNPSTKLSNVSQNEVNNVVEDNDKSDKKSSIDDAISLALLDRGDEYLEGECRGESHIVLEESIEENIYTEYLLTTVGNYGFVNEKLTKISGSGVIPAVMKFELEDDGTYKHLETKFPRDGSGYVVSINEMFPTHLLDQVLSKNNYDEMAEIEREYARKHLKNINRDAEIHENIDYKLANIPTNIANRFIEEFSEYPDWIGTLETIEDGQRYVYEKLWVPVNKDETAKVSGGTVTYTKYKYGADSKNDYVEKHQFEISENGEILSKMRQW